MDEQSRVSRRVTNVDAVLGQRLRQLRLAAGMTQMQLAALLGVTFQQVQKYEKGNNRVSAATLNSISALFQVDFAYFFDNAPVSTVHPDQKTSSSTLFAASQKGKLLVDGFRKSPPSVQRALLGLLSAASGDAEEDLLLENE